jgi:catechol 2,3-dioxygenase-like lactoylglutathione lyase family enzyme
MLDHIGFSTADYDRLKRFYGAALKPLGIGCVMEVTADMTGDGTSHAGFGRDGKPFFWVGTGQAHHPGLHVAFTAPDRATVDAFHRAALAAGGRDNGAPGVRPHYHPHYYAAFVLDPDGHNIEAVCHNPAG